MFMIQARIVGCIEMWDLVFETLHEAILKPVDIGLCGSRELHVLVHPFIQDWFIIFKVSNGIWSMFIFVKQWKELI